MFTASAQCIASKYIISHSCVNREVLESPKIDGQYSTNMVFFPGTSTPILAHVPDTVPICDFMLKEEHGRWPISKSLDSYVCGISGHRVTAQQQKNNVKWLARSLSRRLKWKVNEGTEFDKVVAIFALNNVS